LSIVSGIVLIFTAAALGLYLISTHFYGRIRVRLGSMAVLLSLVGLATATVFLAFDFGWVRSDVLSLIGLLTTNIIYRRVFKNPQAASCRRGDSFSSPVSYRVASRLE